MSPLTAFIVEDSATIRQNLVATLEEWAPVQVVGFAEGATEAIEKLTQSAPGCDLAIIDVRLKQGSGVDVLAALRTSQSTLRRVVLTNYATNLVREYCLALGADRVFDKSSDVEKLLDYCGTLATELRGG
jgi:DNA-binding NarL/FixJ family response regulator